MVEFPAEIVIKASIRPGSVFFYADDDQHNANEPHFYVVLNVDPLTDQLLILVCATSKVEKRKAFAAIQGFSPYTLVSVKPNDCNFLSKDSLFDCNYPVFRSLDEITAKYEAGEMTLVQEAVSTTILDNLRIGVLESTLVSPDDKRILDPKFSS